MPNKEFLEKYPLYRKFYMNDLPNMLDDFPTVQINMYCPVCNSNQTHIMTNTYIMNPHKSRIPHKGADLRLVYVCVHCSRFVRYFYAITGVSNEDSTKTWIMKTGQYPAWEIAGNSQIETILGEHSGYYKKGLVCESQGYGIGAFGYYRRIVEEIIDKLLDEIADLMTGDELQKYSDALAETKTTIVAADKIALVKDLLPPILRPEGLNPLSILHSALSEGLHAKSDDECLELSQHCREGLLFLVNQVSASKERAKSFTSSMRKILGKKKQKGS